MKELLKVVKRDLRSIRKNPIALIIIAGLSILPSLYAWINILACWDPYKNTGTIPVAVVNNDKGTEVMGKKLNAGENVEEALKNNKAIGWKFVNSKDADMGVVDGTYYAMIEIPEDFSQNLTSFITNKTTKPEVVYKVDTKANPVAGKITNSAQGSIVNTITTNFVETVDKTLISSVNGYKDQIEGNKDKIIDLKHGIVKLNDNMNTIMQSLQLVGDKADNLKDFLKVVQSALPEISNTFSEMQKDSEDTKGLINDTRDGINKSYDNVQYNLNQSLATNEAIIKDLKTLQSSTTDTLNSETNDTVSRIYTEIDFINSAIDSDINFLETINQTQSDQNIANMIVSLKQVQQDLENEKTNIDKIQQSIIKSNYANKDTVNTALDFASTIDKQINDSINQYINTTRGPLNSIANNLINSISDSETMISEAQALTGQINNMINTTTTGADLASDLSKKLYQDLSAYKDIISKLSDKLQSVNDEDVTKIISIIQNKPEFMADFLTNPFNLKTVDVYSIPNYGSSMTPIYSNLALWVGALLLTSLLKTKVTEDFEGSEKLTIRQKHFGKMLTFVFIGIIQGLIVSLGDKFLLGVYTVNAPLMIMFAVMCSITYTIIVYTLVSVFGNLGKAFSIVFLILQIPSSGGTYPIQVDPWIFRLIQPLCPFTYGVGGFREAIAGPLASGVTLDIVSLILFSAIYILLGYFLKGKLHKAIDSFESKFKKSGIAE
ncbi:YhgE/Pip domain-containing protein [Clostridium sp. 19966]|uniref:YhgE/Pip domain-containing protein n=1 Tax=Clostridium sp. 19966 TaxID=2768166 RepID=UPI0028DE324C|nr:YhgE/Pip domain-containing protein [Clostridium sp. 19966]MDT8717436.1 YhgE/Pip domain-containing protein [Clostridium sp. 19966]